MRSFGLGPFGRTATLTGAALDPLLAEAVLLLRASQFTGADGDSVTNEGTLGGVATASVASVDNSTTERAPAFFGPADGMEPIRFLGAETNEASADAAQMEIADSVAVSLADGFFLTFKGKSLPHADAHGADQAVRVRKGGTTTENSGYSLSQVVSTGKIRVNWMDSGSNPRGGDLGAVGVTDPHVVSEIAGSMVCATGVYRAYVRDDAAPTVTVGGKGWRSVGEATVGATSLLDSAVKLMVGIGKGWVEYAEVYSWDGTTATLAADCNPARDAAVGDTSFLSTTTGETWAMPGTASTPAQSCWIVDATEAGWFLMGYGAADFTVADNAAIDLGTGDGAIVLKMTPAQVATANASFWEYASHKTGGVGQGGVGWVVQDFKFDGASLDGFGGLISDGTDLALVLNNANWTAAEHLVVINLDRDGNATLYIDGVSRATASMTAVPGVVGSLTVAADLILGGAPHGFSFSVFGLWVGRTLTDTEIAALPTLLT